MYAIEAINKKDVAAKFLCILYYIIIIKSEASVCATVIVCLCHATF